MVSSAEPLLSLLQLADSALPIGGYSHSWGLETWVQKDIIVDAETAFEAIANLLTNSIAPQDGIACGCAFRYANDVQLPSAAKNVNLQRLNQYLSAGKWSKETYQASVRMGQRLLKLAVETQFLPDFRGLAEAYQVGRGDHNFDLHHSVVFGFISACAGVTEKQSLLAYLQNSSNCLISACVRLIPLGHTDGQKIVVRLRPLIATLAEQYAGRDVDEISSFAPMHESASFIHESLYSRLFQS